MSCIETWTEAYRERERERKRVKTLTVRLTLTVRDTGLEIQRAV